MCGFICMHALHCSHVEVVGSTLRIDKCVSLIGRFHIGVVICAPAFCKPLHFWDYRLHETRLEKGVWVLTAILSVSNIMEQHVLNSMCAVA